MERVEWLSGGRTTDKKIATRMEGDKMHKVGEGYVEVMQPSSHSSNFSEQNINRQHLT